MWYIAGKLLVNILSQKDKFNVYSGLFAIESRGVTKPIFEAKS